MNDKIAVIGIAGRFPGAVNIEELFCNLKNGKDSVREISGERIKSTTLPDDATYMKLGYLEDIDKFDYDFFNILPAEAKTMDPVQRLLLETVYKTIENAGYNANHLKGSKTSVYMGDISTKYYTHADNFVSTLVSGNSKIFHAARIARQFDFTGNAVMVDSACSTSLVSVALACNELILGQAEYALVAGVNLYLFPYKNEGYDLDIWAPDGVSRAFSAEANGMSRGEVVASILLKPLEHALKDNDVIHAVIKGYSINNNASRSSSPSAPDSASQYKVIKDTWEKAGINPIDIGYIEAHGSGTQLGDSLEIEGLNMVFNGFTKQKHICPISTIKNNIGHSMTAAGLAGLIKCILTIKKGVLFPTVHFDQPNPIINFEDSAVYVNEKLCEFDKNKKYVGVTSLGASGVNCHLVLEKAPERTREDIDGGQRQYPVTLSARTAAGLRRNGKALYDRIKQDDDICLKDISYTLNTGRKHFDYRFSFLAKDRAELKQELFNFITSPGPGEEISENIGKVILVFPHYDGIPEKLLQTLLMNHPLMKKYYDECTKIIAQDNTAASVFVFQYCLYKVLADYSIMTPNILKAGTGGIVNAVISGKMQFEEGIQTILAGGNADMHNLDARAAALVDRETATGIVAFVEMGTGSALAAAIRRVDGINKKFHLFSLSESTADDPLLTLISNLYLAGAGIDWQKYHQYHKGRRVELPTYQFEKTRCWIREEPRKKNGIAVNNTTQSVQPLPGALSEGGTDLQQSIAKIWCGALKINSVTLEDNFFDIGGNSLNATAVINRLNKDMEVQISFEDLFDFPTIKQLSVFIDEQITTEQKMCNIWKEVLQLSQVKPGDNFFTLGGHSLLANQVLLKVNKEWGVALNFEDIFRYQTVSSLAGYVEKSLAEGSPGSHYKSIKPVEPCEYYETSPQQRRTWVLSQFKEGSIAYNTPGAYIIEGKPEQAAFEKAFDLLMERHESLRTVFIEKKGIPKQKIIPHEEMRLSIGRVDIRSKPDKKNSIRQIIKQEEVKPFDLVCGPLLRVTLIQIEDTTQMLLFVIHHIISDGWSFNVLFRDLIIFYNSLCEMKANPLKPLRIHYKDYTGWEMEEQKSEQFTKHRTYWKEKLDGDLPVLELPSDKIRPAVQSFNGDKVLAKINKELTQKIRDMCLQNDCTLFMALAAVLNTLMYRYTGQNDLILGFPIANRKHADLEDQIGYYVNTLPLRTRIEHRTTFRELLHSVKQSTLEAYEHQQYHFDRLVSEINPKRDLSRNALFDVMLVLQNTGNKKEEIDFIKGLRIKKYEIEQYTSKMDLLFEFIEKGDEISVCIEFNSDIYFKNRVENMAHHLNNLLQCFTAQPEAVIDDVDYISAAEVLLIKEFNHTDTAYPDDLCVHQWLANSVLKWPGNMALMADDGQLTYDELNKFSGKLANHLRKLGIGRDNIVGICMKRSIEMLIGLFAVLKAGGAYMPISIDLPDERKRFILEDSKVKVVLVDGNAGIEKTHSSVRFIDISDNSSYTAEDEYIENINKPDDLAYVIYTSGTTGNPKGVMIEHHSVINRLNWMQKKYPLGPSDILLQKTPYSFDVSVWELFWWSITGAGLCLLNHGDEKFPEAIISAIERSQVTTIHFVPSMLEVFLEYLHHSGAQERLKSLRQVFSSGEALLPQHVIRFNQLISSKQNTKLINLYGPTEATVDVSYYDCPPTVDIAKVFIGKPIDNTKLYIVDRHFKVQPVGIPGELCIAGAGLARGYLNRPALTAEKFIQNPFEQNTLQTACMQSQRGKMYRTGDIARLLPGGYIEFSGRIDHQVKIRGYRIELGEIETCILNMENIGKCVVVDVEMKGNKQLCAYVEADEEISSIFIRNELMNKLPVYMVPGFFIQLDKIPLNPNGKIDRAALPYPQIHKVEKGRSPISTTERKIVQIWSGVLGIKDEGIGRDSNFFDIGGNSMNIITICTKMAREFSKPVSVEDLFRYPSINSLAQFMNMEKRTSELTDAAIDESINLMDAMLSDLENEADE